MKTHKLAVAMLGLAILGTPVLAATNFNSAEHPGQDAERSWKMSAPEECIWLQKQFDTAIKSHENAPKAAEAKILRSDGGSLCTAGKDTSGIIKLQHALKDLGVTPIRG